MRNRRLYDSVNADITSPIVALHASGARNSFGTSLHVVGGECVGIKHRVDSIFAMPADGAEGVRLG